MPVKITDKPKPFYRRIGYIAYWLWNYATWPPKELPLTEEERAARLVRLEEEHGGK